MERQAAALKELQARLFNPSRNSSKPPSSFGNSKPPVKLPFSLRRSGEKPNGGQPGHIGATLKPSKTPSLPEIHEAMTCGECGTSLKEVSVTVSCERQVFVMKAIRIEMTAHRASIKICPLFWAENRGEFPADVTAPVQYGNGVKAWATYFTHQHFIPLVCPSHYLKI